MAISRILSADYSTVMIIYLPAIARRAREPLRRSETAATEHVMRRYPRISGPADLPLFCLAPHGVFPASQIAPRAVSSYLAFSTLPVLRCQRTGGVFSVTLSVDPGLGRARPRVLRGMLPYGVRTFLSRLPHCGMRQRSSAIDCRLPQSNNSSIPASGFGLRPGRCISASSQCLMMFTA